MTQSAADEVEVLPAAVAPNPAETAQTLLALTMLASLVKGKADRLRDQVRDWSVGSKIVLTLPNPDDPALPYKVGEVRCDGGAVVPSVTDPDAFALWVRDNAREHAVVELAHCTTPEKPPTDNLIRVLTEVFAGAQRRCVGPFAEPAADVLWELLRDAGWTLAPVVHVPERTVVQPGYVHAVLEMSKREKEPVAPGGLVPDGVTVSVAPGKPYVESTKDRALVQGFVESLAGLPLPAAASLALEGLT